MQDEMPFCHRTRSQMIALSRLPHSKGHKNGLVCSTTSKAHSELGSNAGHQCRNISKKIAELANETRREEGEKMIGPETFFNAKRTFCGEPSPKFVDGFRKVQKLCLRPT